MAKEIKVGQVYGNYTVVYVTESTATIVHNETHSMHILPLRRVAGWAKTHN